LKRLAGTVLVLAVVAAYAALAGNAQAPPRVCEGLTICSPVAGPWVVVPGPAPPARVGTAVWQLECPDGFVGGLDARVANPWIEVRFPGLMGSPVNPGITTRRTTIFQATSVGPAGRPSSFIPFIGCIPAEGGPRTPTGVGRMARPEQLGAGPIVRVVRVVEIRRPRVRAGLACPRGQRLVGSEASTGIYTALHPTSRQLAKVHLTKQLIHEHVWITATRYGLSPRIPVQVQIHVLCTGQFTK
jgi:hypothetical protein